MAGYCNIKSMDIYSECVCLCVSKLKKRKACTCLPFTPSSLSLVEWSWFTVCDLVSSVLCKSKLGSEVTVHHITSFPETQTFTSSSCYNICLYQPSADLCRQLALSHERQHKTLSSLVSRCTKHLTKKQNHNKKNEYALHYLASFVPTSDYCT